MDVYPRIVGGKRIWYAVCHYVDNGEALSVRKSTGIRDDGTAKSRESAEVIGRDLERKFALEGSKAARSSKTLEQGIAALIARKKLAGKSQATIDIVTEKAARLYDHFGRTCKLNTINAKEVIAYATKARETRAVATVGRELLHLREAFQSVNMKPPAFPDIGAPPPARDRVLEIVEQQKLLAVLSAKRRLCVLAFLQLGGIRKDEFNKVTEIDWDRRFAFVNGTKTKKSARWVPIPDELFEELAPYRDQWIGHNAEGWLPRWLKADRDLRKAARRAGIEVFSCNDLRRTYATFMARAGVSSLVTSRLMGTSERMLAEVYARLEKRADFQHEAVAVGVPTLRRSRLRSGPSELKRTASVD